MMKNGLKFVILIFAFLFIQFSFSYASESISNINEYYLNIENKEIYFQKADNWDRVSFRLGETFGQVKEKLGNPVENYFSDQCFDEETLEVYAIIKSRYENPNITFTILYSANQIINNLTDEGIIVAMSVYGEEFHLWRIDYEDGDYRFCRTMGYSGSSIKGYGGSSIKDIYRVIEGMSDKLIGIELDFDLFYDDFPSAFRCSCKNNTYLNFYFNPEEIKKGLERIEFSLIK